MSKASAQTAWEVEATNLTEYAVRRSQMGMQFSNPSRPVFFLGGCAIPLASARLHFFRNVRKNETVAECLAEYDDAVQCVLIDFDGAWRKTFGAGYYGSPCAKENPYLTKCDAGCNCAQG